MQQNCGYDDSHGAKGVGKNVEENPMHVFVVVVWMWMVRIMIMPSLSVGMAMMGMIKGQNTH